MAEVDGLALGQEALCMPGGREAWKWGLDAVVLLPTSVLPGSFWSPRPHTPLLRPTDPMALRSKPCFLTSAFEAPASLQVLCQADPVHTVPCRRLTGCSDHQGLFPALLTMGFQPGVPLPFLAL